MAKQESEKAELLYQMEQGRQELDTRKAALDAREDALDEKEMELQEKEDALEQREKEVGNLEEQKKELQQGIEAVRKKEEILDEAVRAVSEIPPLDEAVDYILDHASIEIQATPGSPLTFPFIARRYLEHIQYTQKKEAENIREKAKKAADDGEAGAMQLSKKMNAEPARKKSTRRMPEYTFSVTQPDNDMEY